MRLLDDHGQTELVTDKNFHDFMNRSMYIAFDTMLRENFGINSGEFIQIIKNNFPEKYI